MHIELAGSFCGGDVTQFIINYPAAHAPNNCSLLAPVSLADPAHSVIGGALEVGAHAGACEFPLFGLAERSSA